MIAEYNVNLKNKTKNELILFIKELQDMLKQNSAELAEKSAEIEKYKYLHQKALDNTIKADRENIQLKKQIDLMAEQLAGLTIWNNEKEEPLILGDKEEIKQYFEQKATNNG